MLVLTIKYIGKKNLQQGVSEELNANKKLRVTKTVLITEIFHKWTCSKLVQRDAAGFGKMQIQLLLPRDTRVDWMSSPKSCYPGASSH